MKYEMQILRFYLVGQNKSDDLVSNNGWKLSYILYELCKVNCQLDWFSIQSLDFKLYLEAPPWNKLYVSSE